MVRSALLLVFLMAVPSVAAPPQRPNILLILADDQTWRDVACYGNRDVHTPNIDRLASQGMRFTNCFTSTAMCAPTRQQLYTGLFPVRNGAFPNHSWVYNGTKSIVHHLQALGYRVGISGKTHFGPPDSFPFEKVTGPAGQKEFISRDKDQPYCLVIASNSPHLPWSAGDPVRYNPQTLTLPPYLVDTPETRLALTKYYAEITDFDREVGEAMTQVDASGSADNTIFIYTSEQGAQTPHSKWTCYDVGLQTALVIRWPAKIKPGSVSDALVQYVDLLPTLLEAAGADPTRIDTGRPGALKGGNGFDGRSFLNVLLGKTSEHREAVFGVQTTRGILNGSPSYPIRSIRTGSHKLIWNLQHEARFSCVLQTGDGGSFWASWLDKAKTDERAARLVENYQRRPEFELYDLRTDPWELNNLADDPTLEPVKQALLAGLKAWMKQQGDEGVATELKALQRQGKRNPPPPQSPGQSSRPGEPAKKRQ